MDDHIKCELSCLYCVHYEACKVWVKHCNELADTFGFCKMDFPFTCAVPNRLCKAYYPTDNVVDVVRCKDCVYASRYGYICRYSVGRTTSPDDYCKNGEKMNGEGEGE